MGRSPDGTEGMMAVLISCFLGGMVAGLLVRLVRLWLVDR